MTSHARSPVSLAPEGEHAISTEISRVAVAARRDEPIEHEVIADPDRIRRTLWRLAVDEARGVAREARSPLPYRPLRLVRMQPARELPLSFDVIGGCTGQHDLDIQLFSRRSVCRFSPVRRRVSAGLLTTELPRVMVRQRHRRGSRARVAGVRISFAHPAQPHARVVRDVVDDSLGGLGMRVGRFDGLAAGDTLEAEIDWQERARVRARRRAAHLDRSRGPGRRRRDRSRDRRRRRRAALAQARGAHALAAHRRRRGPRAGGLGVPGELRVLQPLGEVGRRLSGSARRPRGRDARARVELGARIAPRDPLGTRRRGDALHLAHIRASALPLRAREAAWTRAQRDPRQARDPRLYVHAVERMEADPRAEWMIVWVQAQAELSRHIHHELATRYAGAGRSVVLRVDVMEAKPATPPSIPSHVGPARDDEIAHVLARSSSTSTTSPRTPSRRPERRTPRSRA